MQKRKEVMLLSCSDDEQGCKKDETLWNDYKGAWARFNNYTVLTDPAWGSRETQWRSVTGWLWLGAVRKPHLES